MRAAVASTSQLQPYSEIGGETFVQRALRDPSFDVFDGIDDAVSAWHAGHGGRALHTFLGLTPGQYRRWVHDPRTVRGIVEAHRGEYPSAWQRVRLHGHRQLRERDYSARLIGMVWRAATPSYRWQWALLAFPGEELAGYPCGEGRGLIFAADAQAMCDEAAKGDALKWAHEVKR